VNPEDFSRLAATATRHLEFFVKRWGALVVLAAAQFIMVLDSAVMNVSIGQLVEDFDTTVATVQGIITLYALVMAMFMVTGGKIGDLVGRRRAFGIGLVIYGTGSALTAIAPTIGVMALGWSVLEGIGAALVLPALAALIAGNYADRQRVVAYSVIGGVAGAGIAVGPILGGWITTDFSWRYVFAGEVVLVLAILAGMRLLSDAPGPAERPRLDVIGVLLSASGLGLMVFGVLQASSWGWLRPTDSPLTPLGFSLTPFVVASGACVLWLFVWWQRRRVVSGRDPLVHLELFGVPPLRAGLQVLTSQNLILMGVFFTIPLYLQLVIGLNALETGLRMLPVSVAMFACSMAGSWLAMRISPRSIIRAGLVVVALAIVVLLGAIDPELVARPFAVAMALLGAGMGLVASQLGNVVQSSVDASGRSEAGGLQYTAQQLGSAVGVALVGAIVLTGLVGNFVDRIDDDPRLAPELREQVTVAATGSTSFVPAEEVRLAAEAAGIAPDATDAIVEGYEDSQLVALKSGLLATLAIVFVALVFTRHLPSKVVARVATDQVPAEASPTN
jgi:EmrB/QacA subfamily drug resistance transporter